jgi:catechol 2,3-dioxygenase-like lactoylglutathione lyase family enzyme
LLDDRPGQPLARELAMIVHVALEVSDLARSARFYDAVFHALGARRTFESERALAYGRDHEQFWIVDRGRPPGPGYGHVAIAAAGRAAVNAGYEAGLANGGSDDGKPGMRPQYGPMYYAAYLLDPDGLRLELVAGAT